MATEAVQSRAVASSNDTAIIVAMHLMHGRKSIKALALTFLD
jgi:hypothetical protein